MGDKLVIKQSGSNIEIPIMGADASVPRLGIKGKGYIPLDSNETGSGVYVKLNGNKYKLQTELNALKFSSDEPFTLSVTTPSWDGTLEYTTNNGNTWSTWDGSQLSGTATQPIYLRGTENSVITGDNGYDDDRCWTFTGKYCTGNIENLLDYQTVANGEHPTMANSCYRSMFYGCSSLTQPPELPATTLAQQCYQSMFYGCNSLTQAPELPATTLAPYCYSEMFTNCKFTQAPELPAIILAPYCYSEMFTACKFTQAPELPATTLAPHCYHGMFRYCNKLTQAPELPATTLAEGCYQSMFLYCLSLTQAPELPATTLAVGGFCYNTMFNNCTSLTTAPKLPATTLTQNCYENMFKNCTSLKLSTTQTGEYQYAYRIPTSGTGTTAMTALSAMFYGTGGTFTGTPTINTTYYTDHESV